MLPIVKGIVSKDWKIGIPTQFPHNSTRTRMKQDTISRYFLLLHSFWYNSLWTWMHGYESCFKESLTLTFMNGGALRKLMASSCFPEEFSFLSSWTLLLYLAYLWCSISLKSRFFVLINVNVYQILYALVVVAVKFMIISWIFYFYWLFYKTFCQQIFFALSYLQYLLLLVNRNNILV